MGSVAKAGTPRTLDELREIYADAPPDVRERVERLWRAVEYAESRGIRASHIEEQATSRGHLSHVFAGRRRNLANATLEAYARETGVSPLWLVSNHGPMVVGAPEAPTRQVVLDARYPTQELAAEILRAEAKNLELDAEVVELAIAELRETHHDHAGDPGPMVWFGKLRDVAAGIRRERLKLGLDERRAAERRETDAKRAAEMEQLTKPNLRRKAGK